MASRLFAKLSRIRSIAPVNLKTSVPRCSAYAYPGIALRIARAARSSPILNSVRAFRQAVPATFAIGVFVVAVVLLNALGASIMSAGGWFCQNAGYVSPIEVGESVEFRFKTGIGCESTRVYLEPGATYRVEAENLFANARTVSLS